MVAAKAQPVVGIRHLRNHSFTMMGYARFKYNKGAGEVFEVAGDDDIWIYVDGVLAVDLGGTHLPALGKVDMDFLASHAHGCHSGEPLSTYTGENENCDLERSSLSWKHGSWHHLHFFYAERQSDASNSQRLRVLVMGRPLLVMLLFNLGKMERLSIACS